MSPKRPAALAAQAAGLLLGILLAASPCGSGAAAADGGNRLFEVYVNGRATKLQSEFVQQGDRLSATPDDLQALGVQTRGLKPDGEGRIVLDSIPGVTWRLDEQKQELHLTAPDAALVANVVGAPAANVRTGQQADFGAVLNYDLLATKAGRQSAVSGLLDMRFPTPWGVGGASWLAQTGLPGKGLTRLDTGFAYVDPETLRRWQAGDTIAGSLGWTRPFRLGGIQVASDFSARPDLVTYPVPLVGGRADVPSTVDLFVNNVRQLSQSVDQGPFQVRQPPVVTGAGDVAVVVRDVTGREHVQTLSFYITPVLLASGLVSYSAEAGWVRQRYALPGDRYSGAAVSGSVRYGLTDWLTLEGHAEASGRVAMGGGGVAVNLMDFAVANAALAGSNPTRFDPGGRRRTDGEPGMQFSVGVERTGRVLSVGASTTRATRGFQDVAASGLDRVPTSITRASLGVMTETYGALRLTYAAISRRSPLLGTGLGSFYGVPPNGGDARVVAATYTRPVTDTVQFFANAYRDLASGHGATGVTFGITLPLGSRSAAVAGGGLTAGRASASVEASQAAFVPGEWGWRARLSRDPAYRQGVAASYVAPFGTAFGEVDRVGRQTGLRAGANGAVVATPQGVFASNRINDSYVVVDAGGLADVGVLQENRPIGRTDSNGKMLVPTMRGWQQNRIALDPADLPGDATFGDLQHTVQVPARSGARVAFEVRRGTSAMLRLVDGAGQPVAVGSVAVPRDGSRTPVGHGGEVFLNDLQPRNTLRVETVQGSCTAEFAFVPKPGALPVIGPVPCKPNQEAGQGAAPTPQASRQAAREQM